MNDDDLLSLVVHSDGTLSFEVVSTVVDEKIAALLTDVAGYIRSGDYRCEECRTGTPHSHIDRS